jgi:hypothetical protein
LREFGDFQTPIELANMVLSAVYRRGGGWRRALEPTCGTGNFVRALLSLKDPPLEICGLEVQPRHVETAKAQIVGSEAVQVRIQQADIFRTNLAEVPWADGGALLVVGNPPWVTNAALGALDSTNLPAKSNLKGLRGFEAKTGESNFDIAEHIWIKLIKELAWARPTIALLCKTQVARNLLKFASATELPITRAELYAVDAKKWFNAAVDACLFRIDVGFAEPDYSAHVFPDLNATEAHSQLSLANGSLVSDTRAYQRLSLLDGACEFEWRQGIKHDLATVMELRESAGGLHNRLGESVSVELTHVFPLLKSSDLHRSEAPQARYRVIIPQRALSDDTSQLQHDAPLLWAYLNAHAREFNNRKSSIYAGRPLFSIFGIGGYAFSLYKVAVSGLYKTVHFRLAGPQGGSPVMLDDTCYFIPCDSLQQACVLVATLNHPDSLAFINSIIFRDSKRPVTKKVLQRVNVRVLLDHINKRALLTRVNETLSKIGSPGLTEPVTWERYLPGETPRQAQMKLTSAV